MSLSAPIVEVELTALAYGGDALGRLPDGRAVFVPFALPGERVRVRLVEEKRGHARAELLDVLQPSPMRITQRCIHFGVCGGCHYQHLAYRDQLAAKTAILREQLERIGGIVAPPVAPAVPSPAEYYYRNHIQFHLTRQGKLGFYKARSVASPEDVFPIEVCHLPDPLINIIWPQLNFEDLPDLERIGLRLGSGEDVQLILEGQESLAPDLTIEELPISVVHLNMDGALVLAGSASIAIEILGRSFRVSAGSFFQVNTPLAEAMVNHLMDNLPLSPQDIVLDVYCGVGLFSAFLAGKVQRLIGIEASPQAADDFVENLDEFDNVEIYEAPAEEVLPALDVHPRIVIVDPPRAGLDRRVIDELLRLKPEIIAYISCDPSTLGRDARRLLAGGYQLRQVTPFDLFPQTYHIESISFWDLRP